MANTKKFKYTKEDFILLYNDYNAEQIKMNTEGYLVRLSIGLRKSFLRVMCIWMISLR